MLRSASLRKLAFAACLITCGEAEFAQAYEAEVRARTDAQFYTLRSPFGEPLVRRRRYTQTLSLNVWDIADSADNSAKLAFRSRLRLDTDFGLEPVERDPRVGGRFQSPASARTLSI